MQTEIIPQEEILSAQKVWQNNPVFFSEQLFNLKLWQKQVEVINALRDHKKVAVKSGHTIGKSLLAADATLWFLLSYYPSKVIITAPTFLQVEEIIFK